MKLEKTSISKTYKKVRCIKNTGIRKRLTLGEVYNVFGEDFENYHVVDDENELNSFDKARFEEVVKEDFEEVLKLEYKEVWDKTAIKVVYQDETIFKRDAFRDEELNVVSHSCFFYSVSDILFIRGNKHEYDNAIFFATKEEAENIKEKVLKINKKYGKVKTIEEIITSYPTVEFKSGLQNYYLSSRKHTDTDLEYFVDYSVYSDIIGIKYFSSEIIDKMVEELNKRRK